MSAYQVNADPTAVVGRRFGAYVVDAIVVAAIPIALFFATAGINLYESPTTCAQIEAKAGELSSSETCTDDLDITINDDDYSAATFRTAAPFIAGGAGLLYVILVQWVVQAMTGATLGKAIFGIRTVNEEGQAPGIGKQFVRGVLWIVDGLCNGLVAAILILVSKGHRRLGDMAADTFVVRSAAKGSPVTVPGMGPGAAAAVAPAATYAQPVTQTQPVTQAPPAPQTPREDVTQASPTAPGLSGPQWDASRNAYIQWDPNGQRWLTYDDAEARWKAIEGEQPPPPA